MADSNAQASNLSQRSLEVGILKPDERPTSADHVAFLDQHPGHAPADAERQIGMLDGVGRRHALAHSRRCRQCARRAAG